MPGTSDTSAGGPARLLADVALPVPVPRAFTYEVTEALRASVQPGVRAVCPFGSRRLVGLVLGTRQASAPPGTKALAEVMDAAPVVPGELLTFLKDVAGYYLSPIGEVVKLALPPAKAGKAPPAIGETLELVKTTPRRKRPPKDEQERTQTARTLARVFASPEAPDEAPALTDAQTLAVTRLGDAMEEGAPRTYLLRGVTGSGKTEVYLQAIARARARGKGVLVLVPEIALTPQLVARYRARFGDDVAVLHSALTPVERLVMWRRLHQGEVRVAIGARSALFAPIHDLGLVVVDEEHDPSFKQEEGVRYHGRDMAILRAHRAGAVCVLGSATPSLEAEHLVTTGKAERLLLPGRARSQPLPAVEIVDLRHVGPARDGERRLSVRLVRAVEETLAAGEQTILFLNRRGFAPTVACEGCGTTVECPSCSVALTFHKGRGGRVRCHYCDHEAALPPACAKCGEKALALEGLGTEKLEEAIVAAFPQARVARLDRDVASGREVEKVLARMRAREVDVLVGTQMVTKGHDLPHVTLVCVVNADTATSIPDFRASERAFQLLVQVAGRAGRGDKPGRVLVQTFNPEHPAIAFGVRHDVPGFLAKELENRREVGFPPFTRMVLVRVDALDQEVALAAGQQLTKVARAAARTHAADIDIKGPNPAPLQRLRGRWRYQVVMRSADRRALRAVALAVDAARGDLPRTVRCILDVDPVQLL